MATLRTTWQLLSTHGWNSFDFRRGRCQGRYTVCYRWGKPTESSAAMISCLHCELVHLVWWFRDNLKCGGGCIHRGWTLAKKTLQTTAGPSSQATFSFWKFPSAICSLPQDALCSSTTQNAVCNYVSPIPNFCFILNSYGGFWRLKLNIKAQKLQNVQVLGFSRCIDASLSLSCY